MPPTELTAHVDDERERVADSDGPGHARARRPVAGSDLHVTLGRRERERERVPGRHPGGGRDKEVMTLADLSLFVSLTRRRGRER